MEKIVITGGPCAGKTSVLKALEEKFSEEILILPEVATILFSGGFPVPGKDIKYSLEWVKLFQQAVLPTQKVLEEIYSLKAKELGISVLVCDRGQLDGAAYMPGGIEEFCKYFNVKEADILASYSDVIHLESTAIGDPEYYGKINNSSRYENIKEATRLELAIYEVWKKHPHSNYINCEGGLEEKINKVVKIISDHLEGVSRENGKGN